MNFTFGKAKPVKAEEIVASRVRVLNASADMHAAFENLTDSYKQLDGIVAVVENLDQAVEVVKSFGLTNQTLSMLNADGGLEALLGPVDKLDAKKALEGMEEQKSGAWEAFKETCKKVIEAIKNFFKMIGEKIMELANKIPAVKKAAEQAKAEGGAQYNQAFISTIIPNGMYAILPGVVDGPISKINLLVSDLIKYTELLSSGNYNEEMFQLESKLNNTQIYDTLEEGKFFLKSKGEAVDTWKEIGYTTADQVVNEMSKLSVVGNTSASMIKVVNDLENRILEAKVDEAEGEDRKNYIHDVSQILSHAKKVSEFVSACYRVWKSMIDAAEFTLNKVKSDLNIKTH